VVGARWDKLSDDGFTGDGDFEQWTLHASWYTRPNVQLGAELRFLDFEESSSGADDEDEAIKGRLIARFGF
jgi:phosphate-selective porin